MRFLKYIYAAPVLILALCSLWSCSDDDDSKLSEAVLASASTLNFEGNNAAGQIITVYADAEWVAEVPEWVTISPTSGNGVTDVTISVANNMRDGSLDNPRKASIIFKGRTLASQAEVLIIQAGDKYRDVKDYKVSEVAGLKDETVVSIPNITVMAITTEGFVATDDQKAVNIYVLNNSTVDVSIGDKVTIMGAKYTNTQSLPYIDSDKLETISTGTVTYPTPTDVTDKVDTYNPGSREFIVVEGILNGNNISVDGASNMVNITDAPESLNLAALNGHRVTVKGYFAGVATPVIRIMATEIQDDGVVKVIYFAEDFEWILPWAEVSGAGQTVEGSNSGASAPNVYTHAQLKDKFVPALEARGYELICNPSTTTSTYLQKNYLKFGRTDVQAGIVLPPINNIPANTKVRITFDWAPMIGGTGKFDPVEMIVLITNGTQEVELGPLGHTFVDTVDRLSWLHADLIVDSNVAITESTKITIRSKSWGETKDTNNGNSVYQRWFIDNIEISKAD